MRLDAQSRSMTYVARMLRPQAPDRHSHVCGYTTQPNLRFISRLIRLVGQSPPRSTATPRRLHRAARSMTYVSRTARSLGAGRHSSRRGWSMQPALRLTSRPMRRDNAARSAVFLKAYSAGRRSPLYDLLQGLCGWTTQPGQRFISRLMRMGGAARSTTYFKAYAAGRRSPFY